ncbi:hypothetical protein Dehly_0354 [Dehalogenimonas lykanthroporepellens BL-DC-9]|jgi:putative lipase involved disintegration of autophagic bodies|nr:hypothetical protein Dehly_0354 [Dehalogenimonas lykanthroporepellens BL-DC-9]
MNRETITVISAAIRAWEESEGLTASAVLDRTRLVTVITMALNAYMDPGEISLKGRKHAG